jgi:hypothetical protein
VSQNSLSSIRTALDTNLSAVSQLKEVKAARTTQFDHFPCCRHYLVGVGDQDLDTASNYRTYRFGIDVVMPYAIKDMSKETAEATFQDAVDAVMDKLNAEWDDSVDHSIVDTGAVRQVEDWPMGPCVAITIIWQARTLYTF